jgi:hypothetical protein
MVSCGTTLLHFYCSFFIWNIAGIVIRSVIRCTVECSCSKWPKVDEVLNVAKNAVGLKCVRLPWSILFHNLRISRASLIKKTEFLGCKFLSGEPGSSVSVVSGYGLDDRAIEVRSPAEAKEFLL